MIHDTSILHRELMRTYVISITETVSSIFILLQKYKEVMEKSFVEQVVMDNNYSTNEPMSLTHVNQDDKGLGYPTFHNISTTKDLQAGWK